LKFCATSWDAAGSIPDGVIGIPYCHNLSGGTIKLQSTKFLREMSTRAVIDVPIAYKSGTFGACAGFFSLLTFLQQRGEGHFILLCTIE